MDVSSSYRERINKVKAVIFDLDGTLADTVGSICEAVNMAMREFDFAERNYDDVVAAIGNGARLLIKRLLPQDAARDEAFVDEVLAFYDECYKKTYLHCRQCYDGIPELIELLKARGLCLGVLSNKQDFQTKGLVDSLFPSHPFDFVQGQTDLPKKPDPTVPLMAAKVLCAEAYECLYVGDSDVDVLTAKNAGMLPLSVSWGYRTEAQLRDAGAEVIARDVADVLSLFRLNYPVDLRSEI